MAVNAEQLAQMNQLAASSAAYWALLSNIKLPGSFLTFPGREYLWEILQDKSRRRCYIKGTQNGITLNETCCRTLHDQIYGMFPKGVGILFPTNDNVIEFSKARFTPLINSNPETIGKFIKPGGKGTDSASLKQVGESLLYLIGARLSQSLGSGTDEKESAALRSKPLDCVKFEEMDLIDDDVIEMAKMRMGDSEYAEEVYISNPTLEDFRIDRIFNESDQRHWHKRCPCGTWFSVDHEFIHNQDCIKIRSDGTGYIACPKCGLDIGPKSHAKGEWVPDFPSKSRHMHGWRLSHFMSVAKMNDPAEILKAFNDPPNGNLANVYRNRLGRAYTPKTDQLTASDVTECCGRDGMVMSHLGPCCMGVDVGRNFFNVVIGLRSGIEQYTIIKICTVTSWEELHDLAIKFNVKKAVIDLAPEAHPARAFQKKERFKVWLCQYVESQATGNNFNEITGIVKSYRTGLLDATHRLFSEKNITIPRNCDEVKKFVKQCCNTAKVQETDKKSGNVVYRYIETGDKQDHYRHALGYFYLAAQGSRIVNERSSSILHTTAITEYDLLATG